VFEPDHIGLAWRLDVGGVETRVVQVLSLSINDETALVVQFERLAAGFVFQLSIFIVDRIGTDASLEMLK